jgi:hypothetical protein
VPGVCRAFRQQIFQRLALARVQPKFSHASTDEACLRKIHPTSHAMH